MSYKSSEMVPRQAVSVQTPFHVSPAKARKLEHVMRGSKNSISQHGITQIGFGNDAQTVDVNELYPMEISKSILEEKDIDEYATFMASDKNQNVNNISMRNRRRSSSQFLQDTSSKDSLSGRKRRQTEVPLTSFGNYPHKRHCANNNNNNNSNENNNNSSMMLIDDPNSRYGMDEVQNENNRINHLLQITQKKNSGLHLENVELRRNMLEIELKLNKQMEITAKYETEKMRNDRACTKLQLLLNDIAISERQERETKLIEDNKMLGRVVQHQGSNNGFHTNIISDIWEDGQLFEDLKKRKKVLEMQKLEIESKKKELRKLKSKVNKENNKENHHKIMSNQNNQNQPHNGVGNDGFAVPEHNRKLLNKLTLDSEIISIRLALIKKQLNELEVEHSALEYRKKIHIKFIRLMRDEKKSRFCINKNEQCYVLNNRYVLINLLGRGGFSEVHRGYDLVEHKYIAAKIHQLNSQWSDERKRNYTKHATREYDIHKSLNHCNTVSLYDVFGIDVNSFCTVLEYCDGMDLDMYLKINKTLAEREARSLIIQVFIGLKYLHNSLPIIIHYDLKPGNLLYKNGLIKLTDFGLAKIMETDEDMGSNGEIELTSQGAGTYWYLPPECFRSHSHNSPIMISPKVDIWSGGVIFYQMLFGKRPFGDSLSQDTILNNKTILNAHNVSFPNQPKSISKPAKEFISQCCAYDPKLRLSSNQIVDDHPYFSFLRR